jgi:RimJ/RimL family protein N-acetyltransferase
VKVSLRLLEFQDFSWLLELETDELVRKTTLQRATKGWSARINCLSKIAAQSNIWAILDPTSKEAVGWIMYGHLAPAPYPAIGMEIRRSCWNRGYATAALNLLLHFLFEQRKNEAVSGLVFTGNIASQRVFEKAGFQNLGEFKCEGHPCYLFELRATDWRAARGAT